MGERAQERTRFREGEEEKKMLPASQNFSFLFLDWNTELGVRHRGLRAPSSPYSPIDLSFSPL